MMLQQGGNGNKDRSNLRLKLLGGSHTANANKEIQESFHELVEIFTSVFRLVVASGERL